jgi:hypothetical protein
VTVPAPNDRPTMGRALPRERDALRAKVGRLEADLEASRQQARTDEMALARATELEREVLVLKQTVLSLG